MTLEKAIERQRLADELLGLMAINAALNRDETYEQNLERRARLQMRADAIREELSRD